LAWRVDFQALLADARDRAKPHWANAEKAGHKASALKPQLVALRNEIKDLEKQRDANVLSAKERQKLEARLVALNTQLKTLTAEHANLEDEERVSKRTGDGIYDAVFNLDIKNPHTIDDDHGDPEELLAKLDEIEKHVATLRDKLKAILAEALLR
jgi:type I restriction enzyme M protein